MQYTLKIKLLISDEEHFCTTDFLPFMLMQILPIMPYIRTGELIKQNFIDFTDNEISYIGCFFELNNIKYDMIDKSKLIIKSNKII
jgi:hypothetical protein